MVEAGEHLDEIDRVLVRELVTDGRATLAHLAATAGLSVSAVQSRVRRLESRGVVTGYTARINPEALGFVMPPADGSILTTRFRQAVLGDSALYN